MMSEGTTDAIFSLESEAGSSPSTSPGGKGQSGPAPARVSRSASPARAPGKRTSDTCGPLFTASSPSADLQRSLASRLQALTDCSGSPEYALTWKDQDMPWGPPICRLRALGRRTSANGFGGWPTPTKGNADGSQSSAGMSATGRKPDGSKGTVSLNHVAKMTGWATPRVTTNGGNGNPERAADGKARLEDQVHGWPTPMAKDKHESARRSIALLRGHEAPTETGRWVAGWATPTTRDHKDGTSTLENTPINGLLGRQVSLSPATTGGRGALAPEFSRWLMGYPAGWENFADSATPSSPK